MLNKKIALSGMSIVAAMSLMAGATFAYFSDVATSSANSFTAGTLNLQLDDDNEPATENVTSSIVLTNLLPGVGQTGFVSLHNPGSANMAEVEFGINITGGTDGGDASVLANVINLGVMTGSDNTCTTNQVDRTADIAAQVGNTLLPVTMMELSSTDFDALPGLNNGETYYVCVTTTMDENAGDEYEGDSVTADFVFTGHQHTSQ